MSGAVQDTFDAVLSAVAHDVSIPNKAASREAVRVAIMTAAREHGGRVTAATIRPHLPTWCAPEQIGSVMNALRLAGYLVHLSWAPNGGTGSRNGAKPSHVWRVTGAIPAEAVQP